eukprot:1120438-Amphidinium_carterae.1
MDQLRESACHWNLLTSTCSYGMPFCAQLSVAGIFCMPALLHPACIPHRGRCLRTHGHRALHLHRIFPAALWSAIRLTVTTSPLYGMWESACTDATSAKNQCHESGISAT